MKCSGCIPVAYCRYITGYVNICNPFNFGKCIFEYDNHEIA